MLSRYEKNKKLILYILFLAFTVLAGLCISGILAWNKALYLELYLILSIFCFVITRNWISTLTLFWLQYTIYSLGYVFSETEYWYNPFFIVIGSFFFLLLGYVIGNLTKIRPIRIIKIKRCSLFRLKWKTLIEIMYIFSTVMWALYIYKNRYFLFGGNLESGRVDAMSGNGILLYSIMLHVMFIPLLYIIWKKKEIRTGAFIFFVCVSCVELISVGYRTPLVISIFCILAVNARLKKFGVTKAIGYFCLMFILAMVYELYRSGMSFSTSALLNRVTSRFDVCMWNYNFVVATFPDKIPFQYGYTNMIDLLMLLPGPGQDFSLWLKDAVGMTYDGGGLVTFIQGSFYIDFGVPGIIIGMFLLGIFKSYVDKKLDANPYITFWGAYIPYAFSMVCGCITGTFILPGVLFVVYKFLEYFAIGDIQLKRKDVV